MAITVTIVKWSTKRKGKKVLEPAENRENKEKQSNQ